MDPGKSLPMAKTIVQKVIFKNTSPKVLYDLYMDQKKHSIATGAQAKISEKTGSRFSAFDGYATGKNLHLVKDRMIVQTWRADDWQESDPDSVFILHFEKKGNDVVLNMIHANLPDSQAESLGKGWHDYYWKPWKKFLEGK